MDSPSVKLYGAPTSAAAIAAALEAMRSFSVSGVTNPIVRRWALQAVHDCPPLDRACEVKAIRAAIARDLRYTSDPVWFDTVSDAEYTLRAGGGDCDDLSVAFATALGAVGGEGGFIVGSSRPGATLPTHVLPYAKLGGAIVPVEVSARTVKIGDYPPNFRPMYAVKVEPMPGSGGGLGGFPRILNYKGYDVTHILETPTQFILAGPVGVPPSSIYFVMDGGGLTQTQHPVTSGMSGFFDFNWLQDAMDWMDANGQEVVSVIDKTGGAVSSLISWIKGNQGRVCIADCGQMWIIDGISAQNVVQRRIATGSDCQGKTVVPSASIPGWQTSCAFPTIMNPVTKQPLPSWAPLAIGGGILALILVMGMSR